ncbi:major outer membrane protein [Campylobacter sp. 2018MI35]|uniref:major outer membrane protein n=1 Tax=Campylobacter sp. 2018MI34 TaxID=2800582 RepID=UPI0019074888|nr:major outer membrane protein [Campylobacter sp. 2018MI34]MBK1992448.1 major outer membrane protein [Campylobacter sp. 2018MI34]
MKLVKLSLVAAMAAGAFSVANAAPLEEVLKDVDVSGVLRYRYDTGTFDKKFTQDKERLNTSRQLHKYRAQINFNAAIADNFKAFMQLDYNAADGGFGTDNISSTDKGLSVRQLYLTYTNDDFATSVIAGRQQLNTIWTDNGIDGLVGTGIKVVNNSIDGITLAAFAVDSTNANRDTTIIQANGTYENGDSDASEFLNWSKNIYGAAALASYSVFGGDINSQLWLAYMPDNAFLYALDVAYSTTIFDGAKWTLEGAYLGNSMDSTLKKQLVDGKNNNFFALRGTVEFGGWDATLGGLYYGKKDGATLTVIEDQGNLGSLLAGEEIFYTSGSKLTGDHAGQNTFGYITAGYTFNETVRVGGDFVYGGTKSNIAGIGGDKMEAVARVDYKYSPKLDFSAFYSYLNVDRKNAGNADHSTVRLQALYKF